MLQRGGLVRAEREPPLWPATCGLIGVALGTYGARDSASLVIAGSVAFGVLLINVVVMTRRRRRGDSLGVRRAALCRRRPL